VRDLTHKQARFIDEYLATGNGAEACRRAGYSHRCAKQQSLENLTKPYLIEAIDERRREMSKDAESRRDFWIAHLESLARQADKEADQLRAVEMLMKAEGWNAPDRQRVESYEGTWLADLDDSGASAEETASEIKGLH